MSKRASSSPVEDFLPQRTETLRESFQEKMRKKKGRRTTPDSLDEFRLLSLTHGTFPEIDSLNDRFVAGMPKLKATLEVMGYADAMEGISATVLSSLTDLFPNLDHHRCCGGNDIQSTLFNRRARIGCGLPPTNHGTDLCHLLEHLAIDMVASIVPGRTCSGLTCGHRDPLHRFDLFLECEDPRVASAALHCGAHVLHTLLTENEPPAGASRYAETAEYFLGRPRSVLNPGDVLADLQGDPTQLEEALRFLAVAGFLEEGRFTFDFSGTVLYRYRLAPELPSLPAASPD